MTNLNRSFRRRAADARESISKARPEKNGQNQMLRSPCPRWNEREPAGPKVSHVNTHRILSIFDIDGDGYIDFNEFVLGLSAFARQSAPVSKLAFIFAIYDINDDGYISNGDLFLALRMMTGEQLSDVQLQQIVDRTIREADEDGDGQISFEEFKVFVAVQNDDVIQHIKTDLFDFN